MSQNQSLNDGRIQPDDDMGEAHAHVWVVDTTSAHPNDSEGYVFCEICDAPKVPTNATIRQFLDLSTAHLTADLAAGDFETGAENIGSIDGIIAYPHTGYGWFMWVPNDIDEHNEPYEIPGIVEIIQRYAREHGCDYVLFDRDGPRNPDLQTWEW